MHQYICVHIYVYTSGFMIYLFSVYLNLYILYIHLYPSVPLNTYVFIYLNLSISIYILRNLFPTFSLSVHLHLYIYIYIYSVCLFFCLSIHLLYRLNDISVSICVFLLYSNIYVRMNTVIYMCVSSPFVFSIHLPFCRLHVRKQVKLIECLRIHTLEL